MGKVCVVEVSETPISTKLGMVVRTVVLAKWEAIGRRITM
jgi:hypothetical protein